MKTQESDRQLFVYVGSSRLAGLVTENRTGQTRIVRSGEIQNPAGFQRGEVTELDRAQDSLGKLAGILDLGEEFSKYPVFVLLSQPHFKTTHFSSSLYFSGYPRVITQREVRQVVEQTGAIAPLPLEAWTLQSIPESFWVNDLKGVQNPLGLEAERIAVTLQIYSTAHSAFRNLSRTFENLELDVQGYYPKTLVLPDGVLNEKEREEEALVLDFSDDTTHLILTQEGRILETRSLDLGSRFLTTRIAETWRVGMRDAERLKERFGSLEENANCGEELVPLFDDKGSGNHQIRRSEFHQKFFGFGEELFSKIEQEVQGLLQGARLPAAGLVLTGGGVKLDGLLDFLGRRMGLPVRIGMPRPVNGATEQLLDPAWAGPIGLVRWLGERQGKGGEFLPKESLVERTLVQLKQWLAAYF